jgi:tetratricopeptide (TPR) repeat protein
VNCAIARRLAAVVVLVLAAPLAANAQTSRTHTVKQILLDGKDATSAGATVTPRTGSPQPTIHRGETIADGTRVDVPAHVVVVIVSTGGASTARLEPGSSITFVSTDKGELLRSNRGKTFFDVVHKTLDFFRVQYGDKIVAGVNGTAFSIDATNTTVTFTCTSDEVSITKTGYLVIGAERKKVSLVDTISAGQPPVTYQPTQTWTLGTFATYAKAEEFYRAQLAAAQKSGDRGAEDAALTNIGNVQENQGQYAAALQSYRQAVALFRELGDRDGEARTLTNIGNVQENQGQYAAAVQSYRQAVALFRELGDRDGEASTLNNIGIVQWAQGQYAAALQSYQQALALKRKLGDRDGEARTLTDIGIVEESQGQYAAALQSHQQALALFRQLGDRDGEARALNNIGIVQRAQGQYAAALQSYQQALALFRELGGRDGEASALGNIGSVQRAQGQYAAALQSHQQALALFRELGDRDGEASTLNNIGIVQEKQSQYAAALQSYQQALSIYQQLGEHGTNVDRTTANIARVKARLGAPASPSPQPSASP